MSVKEELKSLDEFRNLVEDYYEKLIIDNNNEDKDNVYLTKLRKRINELKPRVKQLMAECRINSIMAEYPAPAIGGPVISAHILDTITENPFRRRVPTEKILDLIDETIGYLKLYGKDKSSQTLQVKKELKVTKGFVFIAMPMDPSLHELEDVLDAIKFVAYELELSAERVDDPEYNDRITDRVINSIERAQFVVCDLSYNRPNVYYEAGYAHALGKIPIYIAKKGTEIEFDLKDYPIIFFPNIKELKNRLKRRLSELSSRTG